MNIIYLFSAKDLLSKEEFETSHHKKMEALWKQISQNRLDRCAQIQVFPVKNEFFEIEGKEVHLDNPIAICAVDEDNEISQRMTEIPSIRINLPNIDELNPITEFVLDSFGRLKRMKLSNGRNIILSE